MQPQDRNPDAARQDRGAGLRNFDGRHPDRRPGCRKAAAERKLRRHAAGHRRLQDPHRRALEGRRAGAVRAPDAALREKIEDKLWSIQRREHRIRHPRDGSRRRADRRFSRTRIASGAISIDDMFDTNYVEIAGTNPVQYRTQILDWADRALPPFQEAFLAKDPRMAFCAMIDRNGYLPVHNKIYSHPQRPGDVAWNTANSRNRRIFNDPAGLAAGRNTAPI